MGREIRRVPPNWQHPKSDEMQYNPLYDRDFDTELEEWLSEYRAWKKTGYAEECVRHPEFVSMGPAAAFADWQGGPPDPEYYRPNWTPEEATWFQMYETVTEGTPVTPPFATEEELIQYLVKNGTFWDQRRGDGPWSEKAARGMVQRGWAPSMMIVSDGETPESLITPRDEAMYPDKP